MELFRNANYDFLGRKWLFIIPSLLLLAAGAASLIANRGPRYAAEFTGGAVLDLKWNGTPPVERIRAALPGASVVAAHDLSGSNEVLVSTALAAGQGPAAIRQHIDAALSSSEAYTVRGFESVGPQIGADLRNQAIYATAGASAGMLVYIGLRFRWIYGAAAVLAVVHDTALTIGLFSLTHREISLTVVAALLTLIGYSMNDTIVVFDRIRENRRLRPREALARVVNDSINQTLSRTVLTSGLTLLAALSLLLFGGAALHGFSFALTAGIIVGTYSSIFVASPILVAWEARKGGVR
ncbi:MAG TPA: protein translocase subunit SecF [Bryobacteraceae bacterium]|jgi:preprotein translocase subunit SecF